MESLLFIIALAVGGIATWQIFVWRYGVLNRKKKERFQIESSVLLERVEKVFKVILTEGYYTEIYDHKSSKNFWGLFETNKKALIIAKAKVAIGFDFSKLKWHIDEGTNKLTIDFLPEAEVLSIDPDYKFYDINQGWLHKFKTDDYTNILNEAKGLMLEKALESDLPASANRQLNLLLHQLTSSMNWELELGEKEKKRKSLSKKIKAFFEN